MKRSPVAKPIQRRNKDGLIYTVGKQIVVPEHISALSTTRPELSLVLVGCGGTGSQMLTGLGQIHASLRALDLQEQDNVYQGLNVTVYDPDVVSPFNVGRQLFYESDIGLNKAECLVGRVNLAYGTRWEAKGEAFSEKADVGSPDIVISCVDTAKARRELHYSLFGKGYLRNATYWLDCANMATVGQVVLGQPGREGEEEWPRNREFDPSLALWTGQRREQVRDRNGGYDQFCVRKSWFLRLPCVTELYPDLLDENFAESEEPSCSMVEALRKQSLFVNRTVSAYALDLLWELIREGKVGNQGCYFNLRSRTALGIALKVWPVQAKRVVSAADGQLRSHRVKPLHLT